MKKYKSIITPVLCATSFMLGAYDSKGASTFSNSLTGFTGNSQTNFPSQPATLAGSGLNVTFVWGGGAGAWERINFGASGATFGANTPTAQGDDAGRNYLRTNETDYASVSYSAYVTINRTARESVFFGMGTGALGSGKAPDIGSGNASVFLDLQDNFDNASRRVLGGTSGAPTNVEAGFTTMTTLTGPMRLRMDYNHLTQFVTYSIDYNPSGAFVADQTFASVNVASIAGEWSSGESASIYFGAHGYVDSGARVGMTFTDFAVDVIPEPSAALLGGLGVLALLRRRRES